MEKPIYRQQGWDLAELLPDTSEATVATRLAEAREAVERLEAMRPELEAGPSPERLLAVVREYQALVEMLYVLAAYGSLWFAEDTRDTDSLAYRNRVEHELTALQNRTLFFSLWWKALDDATAERLLPDADGAGDERHFLEEVRRMKPYTLDETVEQVINVKDADGVSALMTLYSMLTNRLEFELEEGGELRKLSRSELMRHVYSPDGSRRADAYRELHRVYGEEHTILGQIYVHRVRDWHSENVEMRGFASPIAVRDLANDLPGEAVETLLEVCRESVGLFHRFFRWKARAIGVGKLRRYDLYAPLAGADEEVAYEDAVETTLSTFRDFDAGFGELAERVFAENHVDSELRKGKKGGAFCSTVLPRHTPWVLLNYTGRLRDVATMAHELGHAVHSLLAAEHSVLTQHASLPLAETASVFAEMLLTDRLLAERPDAAARRELLAAKLDDVYATVLRQAYFTRFEIEAHEAILGGCRLEELDALYRTTLEEQFGEAVDVPEEFDSEWISIPHIYQSPFYCYAYSFGQLLVLALYRRYRQEGAAFVPGYLRLLAHGGSARPVEILREVDVDPTDADFWRGGFAVVEEMLGELEASED